MKYFSELLAEGTLIMYKICNIDLDFRGWKILRSLIVYYLMAIGAY